MVTRSSIAESERKGARAAKVRRKSEVEFMYVGAKSVPSFAVVPKREGVWRRVSA